MCLCGRLVRSPFYVGLEILTRDAPMRTGAIDLVQIDAGFTGHATRGGSRQDAPTSAGR